ncbi:hypothetical protein BRYFOR_05851 [Marvinbryantia formatexigens DSM 14469]|uniref:Periplasmic binding protein domain-containing protein n=2 Tax=Marvinbryantia TaxID=248744 RepID=C6LB56_9FIRM|nr:hypothetical protein BRYFOR_05851 [Marvinbryantia formatexigens DSM 14469]
MMKKLTAVTLSAAMVASLAPAVYAEEQTPADFETFKIGVCEPQAIDEVVIRRDYYENYLAPRYNVEFVFSEQCKDTDDELTFIESCADAGCDAIISYRSEDANQMAQVCEEYGMQYVINTAYIPEVEGAFSGGYETFQGCFGADNPHVGSLFKEWLTGISSEDGSEGFMITSSLAFSGNIQHKETAMAALTALQERYGLEFEDTIENIATTSAPLEVANDKGIKIYIYPGSPTGMEGWLEGVSAALQTGNYGVLIHTGQAYTKTAVVVDEVERNFDMDIKVASIASMSESLTNAFNTEDKFGNSSLDMATLKSTSLVSSMGFVAVYNALTGYPQLNDESEGRKRELSFRMWSLDTLEKINSCAEWDVQGGDKWIMDEEMVNQCLGIMNPDLTAEAIQEVYNGITYEATLERLGA